MDEHEVTKRLAAQHAIMETKISRKLIEEHAPFTQLKRWTALAILFVLTVIVIALLFLFRTTPDRIFVTSIKTNSLVHNYSKNFGLVVFGGQQKVDSENYITSQLAEEGDIVFTNNFYFALGSKMDSFQVYERDSVMYVNGALAGIILDSEKNSSSWLKKIPSDSLNHLQTLIVQFPISAGDLFELKRISDYRKNVSVCILNEASSPDYEANIQTIAKLFTPEILYLEIRNKDLATLAQFKTVKTLVLNLKGICDRALPPLPNLRQCIIQLNDSGYINNELFKNNKRVEKLTIIDDDIPTKCMPLIENLPGLKELSMNESEYFDLDRLHQMAPRLRTLIIGNNCENISAISKFKDLEWLGLPHDLNQRDFDTILNGLSGLEVLEMYGNDSIKNISGIGQLQELKGLVVANQLSDSTKLFGFKQLRYLSIPDTSYSDSLFTQKLAKALPGCIIVPNGGACLGSGWLLLSIPLVTIILYFKRRNSNAARQL